mgnify:CR=1 FL=1
MNLLILANEGIRNANIWYPTILGVLVVVAAVAVGVVQRGNNQLDLQRDW